MPVSEADGLQGSMSFWEGSEAESNWQTDPLGTQPKPHDYVPVERGDLGASAWDLLTCNALVKCQQSRWNDMGIVQWETTGEVPSDDSSWVYI